jgi:hypothetical protein
MLCRHACTWRAFRERIVSHASLAQRELAVGLVPRESHCEGTLRPLAAMLALVARWGAVW